MVQHDIPQADKEKKIVEQEQRERSKDRQEKGLMNTAMYFDKNDEGVWVYKGKYSVLKYLESPDAYQWARSSGPGVYQPNAGPTVNVVPADNGGDNSAANSSSTANNNAANQSSSSEGAKKKDKGKDRAVAKDDSSVGNESASLLHPDGEAQQSHSDSEAQNALSDDDGDGGKLPSSPRKKDVVAVPLSDSVVRRESSPTPDGAPTGGLSSASVVPKRTARLSVGASSSPALAMIASAPASPVTKPSSKELKIEKKKEREEQKALLQKAKQEKKKGNAEMLAQSHSLPTLKTGYVKMRNSLKKWQQRWIVLQPGRLIYFRGTEERQKHRFVFEHMTFSPALSPTEH
jgi:hypothetical protein